MLHEMQRVMWDLSHGRALGAKVMDESGSQGSVRGDCGSPMATQRVGAVTQHWPLKKELKIALPTYRRYARALVKNGSS